MFLFIATTLSIIGVILWGKYVEGLKQEWTNAVERTFITTEEKSNNEKYFLDRKSAILVKEFPRYRGEPPRVSRIYKNRQGEYFHYIGDEAQSIYFSHLSEERAKEALLAFKGTYESEFGNTK
jgi:hypothetical protein